jgi:hypothetical protein
MGIQRCVRKKNNRGRYVAIAFLKKFNLMAFNTWENLYCFREFSIVYLILMLNSRNMLRFTKDIHTLKEIP